MSTRALVLQAIRYKDHQLIIKVFSEARGALTLITSAGGKKGKTNRLAFQPLAVVDVQIDYKEKHDMHRIKDLRIQDPHHSMHSHPAKVFLALFMAELTQKSTRNEGQSQTLFEYLVSCSDNLEQCTTPSPDFAIRFILGLVAQLGIRPHARLREEDRYFNLNEGTFDGRYINDEVCLDIAHSDILNRMLTSKDGEQETMKRSDRQQLVRAMIRYLQIHSPGMGPVKSLDVLESILT
ncbi:MAG: DNA repair protein RecO [Flavobacteriales bacterium]|nr:DNA repair protein RecO [Flavobacteriales bacterium]